MTIFEASMLVMAGATVLSAVSTVGKNIVTARKLAEAERVVKDLHARVGFGAEVGALFGAGLEALVRPAARQRLEVLEANEKASKAIVEELTRALEQARANRDRRGSLAEAVDQLTLFLKVKLADWTRPKPKG